MERGHPAHRAGAGHPPGHRRGPDLPRRRLRPAHRRRVRTFRRGARVSDPVGTIKHVSAQLRFTDEQQVTILDHFIDGGDRSPAASCRRSPAPRRPQSDADAAYDMERAGVRAMTLAASFQH